MVDTDLQDACVLWISTQEREVLADADAAGDGKEAMTIDDALALSKDETRKEEREAYKRANAAHLKGMAEALVREVLYKGRVER